ncbi:2-C-methyl-D-erythritol 4-phosphate cytidylyltransferase [Ornithinimicrobium sufpigmenti]|uniref:2-C-methyl-D-erythritol 4-phosphate cytidylyltransferase n=1 Tax=Ornithinimicrobium sufpigmenti TaxID=2508882 RepID=UPI0010366360|nr:MULTISPECIES: 2-C-methyl-D-erythritol 4-phosphate cytidylyltransferase [unclassified Ornithinimicrobium]
MSSSGVGLVLVAAGQGTRLGAGMPKALVPLGHGPHEAPIVVHALHAALACRALTSVVVVAPPDPEGRQQLTSAITAAGAALGQDTTAPAIQVVPGGAERSDSVAAGLAALPPGIDVVLVHDAARALTPVEVFDRVVDAVRAGHPAVTPALPVTDTVKQVVPGPDGLLRVVSTLDRSTLRAVQTPQGFLRQTLERAHGDLARRGTGGAALATDDCGMVEACGGEVTVVEGSPRALKITTPHDLEVAAGWLAQGAPGSGTSATGTPGPPSTRAQAASPATHDEGVPS